MSNPNYKKLVKERFGTQEALATILNVGTASVNAALCGRRTYRALMERICRLLQVPAPGYGPLCDRCGFQPTERVDEVTPFRGENLCRDCVIRAGDGEENQELTIDDFAVPQCALGSVVMPDPNYPTRSEGHNAKVPGKKTRHKDFYFGKERD
jgi:hypothetical protein